MKRLAPYPVQWLQHAASSNAVRAAGRSAAQHCHSAAGLLRRAAKSRAAKAVGSGGLALVQSAVMRNAKRAEQPEAPSHLEALAAAVSLRVGRRLSGAALEHEMEGEPVVRAAVVAEWVEQQQQLVEARRVVAELELQLTQARAKAAVLECCDLLVEKTEQASGLNASAANELKRHVWAVMAALWMLLVAGVGVLWMLTYSVADAGRQRVSSLRGPIELVEDTHGEEQSVGKEHRDEE